MAKKTGSLFFILLILPFFLHSDHFTISLWLHSSMFSKGKSTAVRELDEKLSYYKKIGIENLYVFNTLKSEHKKGWSFLRSLIKIAHKKGLKVHPVITSGNRIREKRIIKKHPDWLIRDQFKRIFPYLNLSNPDARHYILKKITKLLKYNIDGIHLDYIRFPYLGRNDRGNSAMSILLSLIRTTLYQYIPDSVFHGIADNCFSYDRETLKRFGKYYKDLDHEDIDEKVRILNEWRKWNISNVTLLVKNVKDLIIRSGKNIPLSAAIISNRDFAKNSLGQDWGHWGRMGIVDVLCPMIYTNDPGWFRERLKNVITEVKGGCRVYAGIAIVSSHSRNTEKGIKAQIRIARELNADGIVLFSGWSLQLSAISIQPSAHSFQPTAFGWDLGSRE